MGLAASYQQVKEMKALADANHKSLVIYISMAFGNPYNDPWSPLLVEEWIGKLYDLGIRNFLWQILLQKPMRIRFQHYLVLLKLVFHN